MLNPNPSDNPVYNEQIAPLMKQIHDICERHDFQLLGVVQLPNDIRLTISAAPRKADPRLWRAAQSFVEPG
jgi:REP element-mobilizing transposase RayT